jgi:ribosomal protein L37AE/L43A
MSDAVDHDPDPILVCPHCDAARILRRGSPLGDLDRAGEGDWYCSDCGAAFDAPAERLPETHVTRSGLARALLMADPDEVAADD